MKGRQSIASYLWSGNGSEPATYRISSLLFLRLFGVIYFIAFISLWTQLDGLVGDRGLLPISDYLTAVDGFYGRQEPEMSPVWNVPTLLWFSPNSSTLNVLCAVGVAFSVFLILGVLPLPTLVALWLCYLSLFHAGQDFLSFQWDILLLEAGFLAVFLAPISLRSRVASDPDPPRVAVWLLWFLLFRLMFQSGLVKLLWNNGLVEPDGTPVTNSWETLTALNYHYWTQPLPIWTSWYVGQIAGMV